ncbi:28 kDa heat- and acid-stable phosphoprotein-like isoform X1 [Hibiscus syriacus]|uniref:28 kDa heat- and acid-stable phosphoprotein-like isoform X1 n=1 Tax=Hibiscus syriacus TaxID=106335 RepID=UPI001923985A|nr:28 kDa heat- and acid-stable phosphoprotein-like isoform X1 [Hibiscus syriacus]
MGRGKFKGKPTGHRHFSTPEELRAGTSVRPRTFKKLYFAQKEVNFCFESDSYEEENTTKFDKPKMMLCLNFCQVMFDLFSYKEEAEVEDEEEESEEEVEEEPEKRKGTQGLIEIENPNLVKQKNVKAKDVDMGRTTELSRREREEIEKQKAHERYMKLQEQGKTEQARKDLERLALIRQQRADAAKKREEEKAAREQKKTGARK